MDGGWFFLSWRYHPAVDYIDFLIAKFIVIVVAAFFWGIYCGFTGRPLWPEHHDRTDSSSDSQ